MKKWLKPILCVGILASGVTIMNDRTVLASGTQMEEEMEGNYQLSAVTSFNKSNLVLSDDANTLFYRLVPNGIVDGPGPIELPERVNEIIRSNPDNQNALSDWTVKVYMKKDEFYKIDGKAEFYNEKDEIQGITHFLYFLP